MVDTVVRFKTAVGRLVQGSPYKPKMTNMQGQPNYYKTGAKKGEPRPEFYFALAIPKTPGKMWWDEEWGQKIAQAGMTAFPNGETQRQTFSWKIIDGDSTVPNDNHTVPANCDGFAGCWILKFKGSIAPIIVSLNEKTKKTEPLDQIDAIKPGDFIQIYGSSVGNKNAQKPGVHLNYEYICFRGFGTRISLGIDPDDIGFGNDPLPQGASLVPLDNVSGPGASMPVNPVTGETSAPAANPSAMMPQGSVQPHYGILSPTGTASPPGPGGPPATVTAKPRMMTHTAEFPYEEYIKAGWNDTQLIQAGLMVPN